MFATHALAHATPTNTHVRPIRKFKRGNRHSLAEKYAPNPRIYSLDEIQFGNASRWTGPDKKAAGMHTSKRVVENEKKRTM